MKEEEFRKCYKSMVEWEPFPAEKARQLLKRILEILFGPSRARLEDKGKEIHEDAGNGPGP